MSVDDIGGDSRRLEEGSVAKRMAGKGSARQRLSVTGKIALSCRLRMSVKGAVQLLPLFIAWRLITTVQFRGLLYCLGSRYDEEN